MSEKFGIASDHGAFELKEYLKNVFSSQLNMVDYGTDGEKSVDYPLVIQAACNKLLAKEVDRLIVLCGTGIGASITANRFKGIRAALCHDEFTSEMSRRHNNANVLVLGGRVLGKELAVRIANKWIETPFEGGRHQNRLEQIEKC
ncbi:MAG: ribose 5-phosphate isomerase B [Leptospiraceae bacterium]|nr:ribose 5-phosphate isomerase B [Leptospiraceae bacterium]MCP5495351.1 ribose 5-phosphate isomerase B [Leptospiraceae bacterium]